MNESLKSPSNSIKLGQAWVWGGITAVVLGYFLVWMPHQSVALSLIGLDISEWLKFLPQMQSGQLPNRNLFYLPPITAGLMLALLTAGWSNGRWQTWGARATAVVISLLAFPSLDAIRFEPASEWQLRLVMIGVVVVVAGATAVLGRWPRLVRLLLFIVALAGAVLPLYAYLAVRPVVAALLGEPIGIGLGLWLNTAGHLIVLAELNRLSMASEELRSEK